MSSNNASKGLNEGPWRHGVLVAFACAAALAIGCGDDGNDLPALEELTADSWNILEPGGETVCSRGTEFAFLVWPGRSDRVVVNFIGGGACWNELTCSFAGSTFSESVDGIRDRVSSGEVPGIFDMTDPANPVSEWTHVVIPYCTGDVHWGDNVVTYTDEITIHHKGAVNSRTVLDWVFDNIEAPDRVLTTGCSAGGYGASMWGAHTMNAYPDAHHVMLADSSAGVITDTFFMDSFPNWQATQNFPDFVTTIDPDEITELPDYYEAFANHFPDAVFAQYNTVLDWNQTFFYNAMGGEGGAEGWSARMRDHIYDIDQDADNFRYFIGGDDPATDFDESTVHCVLNPDSGNPQFEGDREAAAEQTGQMFLSYTNEGVRFVDWLDDLLDPDTDPGNVVCDGCAPAPL